MDKRTILFLSIFVCVLHACPLWNWVCSSKQDSVEFVVRSPHPLTNADPPIKIEGFIGSAPEGEMVHVSSICELPDGRLAAVWYGGSREGAKDVKIYLATCDPEEGISWTKPRIVMDRRIASKELNRYVKKVGNPIVFADSEGQLWLIYVSIIFGGWSCSSLNVKISSDGGATWAPSRRITLSPLINISQLVRNKPVLLEDGGFMLPIYHECLGKYPELLYIRRQRTNGCTPHLKVRVASGRAFIQPSVVALGSRSAVAFLRSCLEDKAVAMTVTRDAGTTWTKPVTLDLPNPNSGLDTLLLSNGRILIAFNDSKNNRDNLGLAVSSDGGLSWIRIAILEHTPGAKYSYPYMIFTRNGKIHLVYTWRKTRIKHVVINESWINKRMAENLQMK